MQRVCRAQRKGLEPRPFDCHPSRMATARTASGTSKVSVDDTRWPILVVTQLVEQLTDAERVESLEVSSAVLKHRGGDRYAMVLDNRKAGPLPATQRKLIAEHMERYAARARSRCVCTAFVSDSTLMRGVLTAIMWLRKPEVETQIFGELEEAIRWARAKLQSAGAI